MTDKEIKINDVIKQRLMFNKVKETERYVLLLQQTYTY